MKRLLRLTFIATLLALLGVPAVSAQDYSGAPGRKLVCDYTIGDAMGEATSITKQQHYFYGQDNLPLRAQEMGKGSTSEYTLSYYFLYSATEENGLNVVSSTAKQWGKYNYGDFGFKDITTKNESKSYNADGKLVKHVTPSYTYLYDYDTNGALIKETWTYSNGSVSKYINYTNDAQGRPVMGLETDKNLAFKQKYIYDYNEDGTVAEVKTYKRTTATNESTEYLYTDEFYTYTDGMLTEILKQQGSSTTAPVDKGKTVYSVFEGNANKIKVQTYTWSASSGKWVSSSSTCHVYEYADFTETSGAAYYVSDVEAVSASDANNVTVTFTPLADTSISYAIFRSGHLVGSVSYTSAYDSSLGKCKFVEEGVLLGDWEYFVVPFKGSSLDNVTVNNPHYISNIAPVKVQTDALKAVQNLVWRYVYDSSADAYRIYLNWDANPNLGSSFQKHEAYFAKVLTNGAVSNVLLADTSDASATTVDFDYQNSYDEMDVFVVSHFNEGTAVSNHITIKKSELGVSTEPLMVYAVIPSSTYGASSTEFNLYDIKPGITTSLTNDKTWENVIGFKCGASVGNKYFAFVDTEDADNVFASLNFTSGASSFTSTSATATLCSMAYEPVSETLYGIAQNLKDDATYETILYSVNTENGELTEVKRYEGKMIAIAPNGGGSLYAVITVDNYPLLYTIDSSLNLSTSALVENEETTVSSNAINNIIPDVANQKVYLTVGKNVYYFDLKSKILLTTGTFSGIVAGATFTKSSVDATFETVEPEPEPPTSLMVYGINPSSSFGCSTIEFDLSAVNTTDKTAVTVLNTWEDYTEITCGASVDNCYYAVLNNKFVSINFTTNELKEINSSMSESICGMAYEPVSKVLYAINGVQNEDKSYTTTLYTVDPKSGALTAVNTYSTKLVAITADGNGGLYGVSATVPTGKWWPVPQLWSIDAELNIDATPVVANESTTISSNNLNSMVFDAASNKAYLFVSSTAYCFDIAEGTFASIGQINKSICGATLTKSTENPSENVDPEPEPEPVAKVRVLAKKTWYGDSMGTVPATQDMREEIYYYGYDGKLSRTVQNARGYQNNGSVGDYSLTRYTKAVKDENGNKIADKSYQYGLYDYGEMGYKLTSEKTYEYNAENQLVKDVEGSTTNEYAYNEAGLLVEHKITSANYGLMQTITYTDFNENGDPTAYTSTGLWSNNYNGEIGYDEKGNKIYDAHFTGSDLDRVYTYLEEWTYDENGYLASNVRSYFDGEGNQVPNVRTTYTPVDGNPDRVKVVDETYSDGKWYGQSGSTAIWEYADYTDMLEPVMMQAMAEYDTFTPGNVNISFTVPQYALLMPSALKIYRDGQVVAETSFSECLADEVELICSFTDTGVKNGEHDYFILPLVGAADEMGDNVEWSSYYICDPISVTAETYLPPVTDLHLAGASTIQTTGGDQQVVTIGWTNPSDRPEGFRSNDLLFANHQGAESSTEDGEATTLDAEVLLDNGNNKKVTLFVLTRYTLGNVASESIDVTYTDFITAGVGSVAADGASFNFANNTITVDGIANIKVFNAAGQQVAAEANVSSLSLNGLNRGVYLIVVAKDNALKAYKVAVK